jgi:DNA-binding PadR family transcriptional regulator
VNDSVSDAAADTTTSPRRLLVDVVEGSAVSRAATGPAANVATSEIIATQVATQAFLRRRLVPASIVIVSMRLNELSLLDQIVLALVVESPRHGFGVADALATDAALAMAVTVRRPLVYRALDDLAHAELIAVARTESGARGAPRVVYRASRRGRSVSNAWLDGVVAHPRDARLELLAKFALRSRRGLSSKRLALAQRNVFEPIATALRRSPPEETPAAALVRRWRLESVAAMIALLRDVETGGLGGPSVPRAPKRAASAAG